MANKQNALGKTNEITVIADETVWEGAIADSLAYYFASAYPVMPQPEPLFDLRHFTVGQLEADRLRRELRTYLVLADLSEEDSPAARMTAAAIGEEAVRECREGMAYGTHLARDRWAQGQIIFFLYGFGKDKLAQAIREKYPAIASRVHQHDSEQLAAATYLNQINRRVSDSLQHALGLQISIPGEFFVASADSSTFWLRSEYTESSHNIILHRLEYREESQLSRPYLQGLRDSLVYVPVLGIRSPDTFRAVNAELRRLLKRAIDIVEADRELVLYLADRLIEEKVLSGDDILSALGAQSTRPVPRNSSRMRQSEALLPASKTAVRSKQ